MELKIKSELKYDGQLSNLFHFLPWIGLNYFNHEKDGVLVLGESHYGDGTDAEDKNLTRTSYSDQHTVFKTIQLLLSNNSNNSEYVANEIVFYNFFQKVVGKTAKEKNINQQMIDDGRNTFIAALNFFNPRLVIVLGKSETGMWKWMPSYETEICHFSNEFEYGYFLPKYTNTYIFHITHPSAPGFSFDKTKNEIKKYFQFSNIPYPLLVK